MLNVWIFHQILKIIFNSVINVYHQQEHFHMVANVISNITELQNATNIPCSSLWFLKSWGLKKTCFRFCIVLSIKVSKCFLVKIDRKQNLAMRSESVIIFLIENTLFKNLLVNIWKLNFLIFCHWCSGKDPG